MFIIEFIYMLYNMIFSWFNLSCFYLTFYFLGKTIIDPQLDPFNGAGYFIFYILLYLYVVLMICTFIASMGNRPQGSKWMYTFAFALYAVIMLYTVFAAMFLTVRVVNRAVQSIPSQKASLQATTAEILFGDDNFRSVVVALGGTLFLYIISSIMYFDPWHMLTSFVQYTLIAPSYINVLNVYAFCNTHDVSWGTKGDNTVSTDLGIANVKKGGKGGKQEVDVQVPLDQKDINLAYEEDLKVLQTPPPPEEKKIDAKTVQDDYYKQFRSNVVLAWILSNGILIALISSVSLASLLKPSETRIVGREVTPSNFYLSNKFFAFVLYSVAALALFRFVGSFIYILFAVFSRGR